MCQGLFSTLMMSQRGDRSSTLLRFRASVQEGEHCWLKGGGATSESWLLIDGAGNERVSCQHSFVLDSGMNKKVHVTHHSEI